MTPLLEISDRLSLESRPPAPERHDQDAIRCGMLKATICSLLIRAVDTRPSSPVAARTRTRAPSRPARPHTRPHRPARLLVPIRSCGRLRSVSATRASARADDSVVVRHRRHRLRRTSARHRHHRSWYATHSCARNGRRKSLKDACSHSDPIFVVRPDAEASRPR